MSKLFPTQEELANMTPEEQDRFWRTMERVDRLASRRKELKAINTEHTETEIIQQQIMGLME